jgi:hypothetical protein
MAHWAEVDENNFVVQVLVTDSNDPNGDEGYQWLLDNLGGRWIKTSYNTKKGVHLTGGIPLRKNFAGVGYTYDSVRDAFIPPKPEPITSESGRVLDWTFNEETCAWDLDTVPSK